MLGQDFVRKNRHVLQEKKDLKTNSVFSRTWVYLVCPYARYKELRKVKVDPGSF